MILLELFWSFFQVGLFSIGGGYAALPLIQNQIVDINGWLTLGEFADVITISQMTPGPIAINAATFVGLRLGGLSGAIIATFGCVTPSLIIVLILAMIYFKYRSLSLMQGILYGLRPAVVALIASAGLSLLILTLWGGKQISFNFGDLNLIAVVIFIASLAVLRIKKVDPILVMSGAGILGLIAYSVF